MQVVSMAGSSTSNFENSDSAAIVISYCKTVIRYFFVLAKLSIRIPITYDIALPIQYASEFMYSPITNEFWSLDLV